MNFLTLFVAILGIAGTVGTASAVFYAARSKSLIALLKDENTTLVEKNTRLEKEGEINNALRIAGEEKVKILQDMATQAPSITELTKVISEQNKEVTTSLSKVASELSHLTRAIGKNMKNNGK